MPRWLSVRTVVAAVLLLVLVFKAVDWTAELLWMRELGYESVFWRLRLVKLGLFGAAFLLVFFYVWLNLLLVARRIGIVRVPGHGAGGAVVLPDRAGAQAASGGLSIAALALLAMIPAAILGFVFYGSWDEALRLAFAPAVGVSDPIFGKDVGFYLFVLPFLDIVQDSLVGLTLVMLVALAVLYFDAGRLELAPRRLVAEPGALRHLLANAAVFLAAWGWGYHLDRYHLLADPSGTVVGAGYTDVHVTRWALWAAIAATVLLLALFAWAARRASVPLAAWAIAGYGGLLLVGLGIVPFAVQQFVVDPSELELETPYLEHNIAFTRRAYALDRVIEEPYGSTAELELADVRARRPTVDNIRLWDWRPLKQTFRQLQQIRAYYTFHDVDVDRYRLDGSYRQVMLSARELAEELPGKGRTWVNRRLQYTHGYGIAMSLAAEKAEDGKPRLILKDLPPHGPTDLRVGRPQVYYGQDSDGYRIVSTGVKEFDYPKGDENVYTSYGGTGGVKLDAGWKRLLFAWHQFDASILLTSYITDDSRIQLWRRLDERLSRIAPFLELDDDPYVVIHDGGLFWIQDAYTTAWNYPYSETHEDDYSYIRNAVKIVVDAYDGSVRFYVVEPEDPVIRAYRAAFPELFRPLEAMDEGLRRHLRYPQGLFEVQLAKYATYHMTVPQVFYNSEDVWEVPREKYAGREIQMQPYYILAQLPGEERLEFLLISPLTPSNRDNMIAWMAARSDMPAYGQVRAYKLSKERLFLGPIQMEAMIDQDTAISRQLSLWDQRGSRVIRGNLLVIPLGESFLYVEPVYLRAETTDIPQLKRIIISDGKRLAMQPTLQRSLAVVFGRAPREAPAEQQAPAVASRTLSQAREALAQAREALRQADWEAFGRHLRELDDLLGR